MQKRRGCLGVDRDWDWGFGDEGIRVIIIRKSI